MARPLRLEFPGALYHVSARGHVSPRDAGRRRLFRDEAEGLQFLDALGEVCGRTGWLCHAYCLLGDRYHLVLETPLANLARGLRQVNGVYGQAVNRRRGDAGPLFGGRYKAILVEREAYLLELVRDVVLAPVAAGLAGHPREWRWSSYRASAGLAQPPPWLATDWLQGRLGGTPAEARAAFVAFVDAGRGAPPVWDKARAQIFLGSERFAEEIGARGVGGADPSRISISPGQRARPLAWFGETYGAAHEAMARAYLSGAYSQAAIARHFGVHESTVSRAARRLRTASG